MICEACGASVNEGGVFPGALVACSCGVKMRVPAGTTKHALPAAVYRQAATRAAATESVAAPSGARLSCPRCRALLADAGEGLACGACGGEFVDHDALARKIDTAHANRAESSGTARPHHARSPPPERQVRYVACVRCGETMNRMNFGGRSGVVVDVCKPHGAWFDAGELGAVLDFVQSGGLDGMTPTTDARDRRAVTHDHATSPEVEREAREAEALMRFEAVSEMQALKHSVDVVDDLVWLLFGVGNTRGWRR